jgi:phosphatidylserine/phosphatidylglycerophosphate/cardiolipin synthase-like enzyme
LLLRDGETCLRVARAGRAALLVDMECYFEAAQAAMSHARRSIHLLNWAFEPQTFLDPGPDGTGDESDRIGNFLKGLAASKPDVDIRILCWDSAMPVAATQHFFPFADRKAFRGTRVRFVLDNKLPLGACHHQKMIVIDDQIAFCGGGDIGPDRWDTTAHLDDDPRREKTRRDHKDFDSRHEVMGLVDGDAAVMLGEIFRERWLRATGEAVAIPPPTSTPAWPACVAPDFEDIAVGAPRTYSAWRRQPEVRQVEALHTLSIREATRLIYMENQYFTSPLIAEALAARLREPEGPEVVLISTQHSPSYFDQATMDKTRFDFISHLQAADAHGRFRMFSPVTTLGKTIIVHAKMTIIDDVLLRIGSANINNRSMGFDSECDLVLEARTDAQRCKIGELRAGLVAHWFGCAQSTFQDALAANEGRWCAALDALREGGHIRLRPIVPGRMTTLSGMVAKHHIGDPVSAGDAWRPWRRRNALRASLTRAGLDLRGVELVPQR